MKMFARNARRSLLIVAVATIAASAVAQQPPLTAGSYMLDGGSYMISAEMGGANLIVHEPNKDTTYTPQPDGSFHAFNPNTNTTYGMRIIDERTLEAFKPGAPNIAPSRLVLVNRATPTGPDISSEESERWSDFAETYAQRSQADPANIQSWTACAAVAMKRSTSSTADADAYAAQVASMLKQMDARSSPCPDVISF
jgi:hypothetical protein